MKPVCLGDLCSPRKLLTQYTKFGLIVGVKNRRCNGKSGLSERLEVGKSELVHLLPRVCRNPDSVLSKRPL